MSPQKRIQHLRSKNKLLLDKLESHSSLIEAEIKYLKKTLRGTAAKCPSGNDKCKDWTKRNSSRQVTEALSSCSKTAGDDSVRQRCRMTSLGKSGKNGRSANLGCMKENMSKNLKNDVIEDSVGLSPGKPKPSPCRRTKSVRRRKATGESPVNHIKCIRDIISLIDYSPKSTFVKRMKSKFEPYTREVYVRVSQETGNPMQKALKEEDSKDTKVKSEEDPLISVRSSLCSECGKKIERKYPAFSNESANPSEDELSKHKRVTMENKLERLKKFREKHWQDCHAKAPDCGTLHCCGHHGCGTEVYGINDRLLAVPLNRCSHNAAHCPPCGKSKCVNSCCAHPKQVLVSLPTTLLDGDAFDASRGRHVKGTKGNAPISKEVLKKFQRPVPQNSMALRYQKGIC